MAAAVGLLPVDVAPFTSKRKREDAIVNEQIGRMIGTKPDRVMFDKNKHLNFKLPPKVHTMKEIGLGDVGISPIAVSEPFSLFTEEAVAQMRQEVLSEEVWANCQYSSNLAQCQLRGVCPK